MVDKKKKGKDLETPEDLEDFMSEEPEEDAETFEEDIEGEKPAAEAAEEELELPEVEEEGKQEDMLDIAADVPVQVVAVMGKRSVTLKEMAALRMGEVIELNRPANEIVDLVAGGKLIAKGELVEIEGKLGVRIVKMVR